LTVGESLSALDLMAMFRARDRTLRSSSTSTAACSAS